VGEWGSRDWTEESFPLYLVVNKHLRQTVVGSAYTASFIEFRVNPIIYLFSTVSLKVKKNKLNGCYSVHKI